MDQGTDVNFGMIARSSLPGYRGRRAAASPRAIRSWIWQKSANGWKVSIKDLATGTSARIKRNLFRGCGGGSLHLLQKSGIAESKGLGGFPIGGQWLICEKSGDRQKHQAQGSNRQAPRRRSDHGRSASRYPRARRKKTLLFGPFAAWTTKFPPPTRQLEPTCRASVRPDNIATLIKIGVHNIPLVRYLVRRARRAWRIGWRCFIFSIPRRRLPTGN